MDELYRERNLCVQLAAKLAQLLGYTVSWEKDAANPDWPVLFIELPTGQVSWHIKTEDVYLWTQADPVVWDGHSTEEKYNRIITLIERPA